MSYVAKRFGGDALISAASGEAFLAQFAVLVQAMYMKQAMPPASEQTWATRLAKRQEAVKAVRRSYNYNLLVDAGHR